MHGLPLQRMISCRGVSAKYALPPSVAQQINSMLSVVLPPSVAQQLFFFVVLAKNTRPISAANDFMPWCFR